MSGRQHPVFPPAPSRRHRCFLFHPAAPPVDAPDKSDNKSIIQQGVSLNHAGRRSSGSAASASLSRVCRERARRCRVTLLFLTVLHCVGRSPPRPHTKSWRLSSADFQGCHIFWKPWKPKKKLGNSKVIREMSGNSVWKICVVMENVENEHNLYNVLILVS